MNKLIPFYKNQEFVGLAEELAIGFKVFITGEKENRIRFKFFLASSILNSPVYRKFSHENSDFIIRLCARVKMELKNKDLPALSRTSVMDAIQVFSKYPSLELLEKEIGIFYSWQDALNLIGRGQSKSQDSAECKQCPVEGHCKPLPPP